jgi:F-type H+-transporting ATPase subunit alpha
MAAYIPTNVISITDGQIYLETEAFNSGIRPAINPGLSVSRVGGAAQAKAMRKIAGPLRTELAQYRELASFAQFSADLDKDTQERPQHGERIIEILKQDQYEPVEFEYMILILYAATNYFFKDVNVEDVLGIERQMSQYFKDSHREIMDEIKDKKEISDELEERIKECLEQFKKDMK